MKDLAPDIVRQRLLIEGLYSKEIDQAAVESYLIDVAAHLGLRTYRTADRACAGRRQGGKRRVFEAFIPLIDSGSRSMSGLRSGFSLRCCSPAID